MNKYVFLIVLLLPLLSFSQTTPPSSAPPSSAPPPISTPVPTPLPIATPSGGLRQTRTTQNSREFETLGRLQEENELAEEARKQQEKLKLARQMIDDRYRKPTKKELRLVMVDSDLQEKFANFLKLENTGLIRLINNAECSENANVVVVSSDCLKNTMPGSGASYSFRVNNYRIPRLADLTLTKDVFITTGDWTHGILVNLGDISLTDLSFQTPGVKFINEFQPILNYEKAVEIDSKLVEGIKDNNFLYSRMTPIRENETYVLRSIAYRGSMIKSANGLIYNEFDYDKRRDILIAFRVVRKHEDGSLTLLWKRLAVKDSPKLIVKNVAKK